MLKVTSFSFIFLIFFFILFAWQWIWSTFYRHKTFVGKHFMTICDTICRHISIQFFPFSILLLSILSLFLSFFLFFVCKQITNELLLFTFFFFPLHIWLLFSYNFSSLSLKRRRKLRILSQHAFLLFPFFILFIVCLSIATLSSYAWKRQQSSEFSLFFKKKFSSLVSHPLFAFFSTCSFHHLTVLSFLLLPFYPFF